MDNIKKIFKVLWKFNFIFEFVLTLILGKCIFNVIYFKKYYDIYNLKYIVISGITGLIVTYIIIRNIKNNKDKLEKIFVSIVIPLAIGYMCFVLITHVPDECLHIYRAYNISKGNVIINPKEDNESIPKDLKKIEDIHTYKQLVEINKNDSIDLSGEEIEFYNASQVYFPLIYIGPVIGFDIANLLNLNVITSIYMMRLINVIIYIIMGYFTIKLMPFNKLLTLTYLCIPMLIHQAASVSADAFINGACLLFISYNMKLLFKKEKYTIKEKILYFMLGILATLNKTAYLPLAFLGLLIVFSKNKNKKDKIYIGITIVIMIAVSLIWYIFITQYNDTRKYIIQNNISSLEQIKFIKQNPIEFICVIIRTFGLKTKEYLYQALGSSLGLLDIEINILIPTTYLIMLILSVFLEETQINLKKLQKIFIILLTLGTTLLIAIALYLSWTVTGYPIIEGIQGRYFLPFIILVPLCIIPKNKHLVFKSKISVYTILIMYLNIISIINIINTFLDYN